MREKGGRRRNYNRMFWKHSSDFPGCTRDERERRERGGKGKSRENHAEKTNKKSPKGPPASLFRWSPDKKNVFGIFILLEMAF